MRVRRLVWSLGASEGEGGGVVPCARENGLGESENELGGTEESLGKVRGRTRSWNVHCESEEQRANSREEPGKEEERK